MDTQPVLSDSMAAQVAAFFSAFSDASRVKLVAALTEGELNVGAIAELVGISESAAKSRHFRAVQRLLKYLNKSDEGTSP